MILHELFESKMSELDIEYQDFLNSRGKKSITDKEFQDAYGMSRTEWAKKNKEWTWQKERQPVAPDAHVMHEDADLNTAQSLGKDLEELYRTLWDAREGAEVSKYESRLKREINQIKHELDRIGYEFDVSTKQVRPTRVAEGAMKDLHTELADKYQELAPKIEKYKDSYLAGELYDALEEIAARHGAMKEFRSMLNGARNRAHMDYDTNPGGFQNWFWYLPFADDVEEGKQSFNKPEPYWVCVDGKKWKRFETYQQARNVHDRLEKKLRNEGSAKKVSLLAAEQLDEKQDACYHKVKSRYKVWPSAYASGALVQCRKKGAANWGNKSKK